MKIQRRSFLRNGLLFGAGLVAGSSINLDGKSRVAQAQGLFPFGSPSYGLPIVQLYTDSTSAQFRALKNPLQPVVYEATTTSGRVLPLSVLSTTSNPYNDEEAIDHLLVEGLQVGADYLLKAFDTRTGAQVEERIFRALDTFRRTGRIAIASCMLDFLYFQQKGMWKTLAEARPDVVLLAGDTCYADLTSDFRHISGYVAPKYHWRRHFDTRRTLECFQWKRLIPILATWDDHDYGGNNSDRHSPNANESLKVFKTMFGWKARSESSEGPGVSTMVELFGQRIFLMDSRFFRDSEGTPNAMHWGVAQEDWMINNVQQTKEPVWLINGTQYFSSTDTQESFQRTHPIQLKSVLYKLRNLEAPVLLGSGDVHYSEINRIEKSVLGYETLEITSSSMHSMTFPGLHVKYKNPRRIMSAWQHNFVIVDTDTSKPGQLAMRARSVGNKLKTLFDHTAVVKR